MVQTVLGRDTLVADALAALVTGKHVSIRGVQGVGATTVLDVIAGRLGLAGQQSTALRAVSSSRPFGALDPLTGSTPPGDRFDALCTALGAHSSSGLPPVLVIDDAHLLDDDSANIVHQVALAQRARLVLATRKDVPAPSAILRLAVDATTQHFDVGELDAVSARQLLATLLPGHVERRTADVLVKVSGGNPSLLRALVDGSVAAGTLTSIRETWRLTGPLHCSSIMAAVVLQPLAVLSVPQRRILDTLALTGAIPLDVALALYDEADLELLEHEGIIVMRQQSNVRGDQGVHVTFASAVLPVVLAGHVGALFRRQMYRSLAEASLTLGHPSEEPVLTWQIRGGMAIDPDRVLAQARFAAANNDPDSAAELAAAAYKATGATDAAILAIRSLATMGRDIEADRLADLAFANVREPFDRAALAACVAMEAWWFGRDTDAALARGLESCDGEPLGVWSDLIEAQRTVFAAMDGDLGAAERSRELCQHSLAPVRLVAGSVASQLESILGDPAAGLAIAEAMFAEALSPDVDPAANVVAEPGVHVNGMLTALLHSARFAEAIQMSETVRDLTIATPSARIRAWTATMLAQANADAGRPSTAALSYAEAEVLWADCGLIGPATWASVGHAQSLAELGDLDGARAAIDRSLVRDRRGFRLLEPMVPLAQAWISKRCGDEGLALASADQAIDLALKMGAPVHLAALAHSLARLDLVPAALRAADAAGDLRSPMAELQLGFARAVAAGDASALEQNAQNWAATGASLYAAEAYALAAELHRRSGARSRAMSVDGLADKLLASADTRSTPPLQTRRTRGGLPPRLAEVAQLAAEGLRAAEIAKRLFISERSVESHLQRIYKRLGITSRADLAAELQRFT